MSRPRCLETTVAIAAGCASPTAAPTPVTPSPGVAVQTGDHAERSGHAGSGAAHEPHAPSDPRATLAGHHHHHGGGMPHRFEDAEAWAAVFDEPGRDGWQKPDEIIGLLQLAPGMVVVDLGAGTGYFVGRLAAAVGARGTVIATDIEPDMIRYLRARGDRDGWTNVRAVQAAPDDPRLAPASVDRILVVDVWHHLAAREAYARQLAAALRPGGLLAIVDFTLEAERGPPPEHRLAPDALVRELAAAGLSAAVVPETLPDQYVVVARLAPTTRQPAR